MRGKFDKTPVTNKFITLTGPGLIYIDLQSSRTSFKDAQLNLFFALLEVIFYLFMFAVVILDKFEYLGSIDMGDQGEEGKTNGHELNEDLNN